MNLKNYFLSIMDLNTIARNVMNVIQRQISLKLNLLKALLATLIELTCNASYAEDASNQGSMMLAWRILKTFTT